MVLWKQLEDRATLVAHEEVPDGHLARLLNAEPLQLGSIFDPLFDNGNLEVLAEEFEVRVLIGRTI